MRTFFPQTPAGDFWSSSALAADATQAWYVRFGTGEAVFGNYASGAYHVRMVRGGQSSSAMLNLSRPTGDYIDHGNGTATHTPTGLTWQRCAKGQIWTGTTCSGTASAYDGNAARAMSGSFAGYADWRLPTITELATLTDYSTVGLAANTDIFPALPNAYFWSKTADTSGHYSFPSLWLVHSGNGSITPGDVSYAGYYVRLVRSSTGTPSCTLTANPVAITAGGTAVLTAACSPAATSYVWTGGTCAGRTTATCTVSPTATTSYSVAGVNATGAGVAASATVTVLGACNASSVSTITPNGYAFINGHQAFEVTCQNGRFGGVRLPRGSNRTEMQVCAFQQSSCGNAANVCLGTTPAAPDLESVYLKRNDALTTLLNDTIIQPLAAWVCQ